eukprot:2452366-Rhodomonas_salina.1
MRDEGRSTSTSGDGADVTRDGNKSQWHLFDSRSQSIAPWLYIPSVPPGPFQAVLSMSTLAMTAMLLMMTAMMLNDAAARLCARTNTRNVCP